MDARAVQPPTYDDYHRRVARFGGRLSGAGAGGSARGQADTRPLVSIVTVALNAADTIKGTIEGVRRQDYANLEYLVIDGGSTDGTVDCLREHTDRIDLWISEQDSGISDAFNKGIARARGDIIGIINAGDWYEPDAVSAAVRAFAESPEAGIVCGWLQYWQDGRPTYVFRSSPDALQREMTVNHPTMFVKRQVYQAYGLFRTDFRYAMDYELALRLRSQGVRFHSLDRVLAHMRAGGVTTAHWRRAFHESRLAKVAHGQGAVAASVYYWFQVVRWSVRTCLQTIGLEGPVRAYRAHWAALRKTT